MGILSIITKFFKQDLIWFFKNYWKQSLVAVGILGLMYWSFWYGRNKRPNCDIVSQEAEVIQQQLDEKLQEFEDEKYRIKDSLSRLIKHDTVLQIREKIIYRTHEEIRNNYIPDAVADSLRKSIIARGKKRFGNRTRLN